MYFSCSSFARSVLLLTVVSSVHSHMSSISAERAANEYIVNDVLPKYPVLASKLMSIIVKSNPSLLQNYDDSAEDYPRNDLPAIDILDMLRPAVKRGLGHCIHNCINGKGNMNFIQCKSMCH